MNIWWISDTHFGHANIIRYAKRPFKSVEEMNERLIANWNSRVKPDDLVYFLGDFCFKNSKGGKKGEGLTNKPIHYLSQLNGRIQFVAGNHENNNGLKIPTLKLYAFYGGVNICMTHKPGHVDAKVPLNLCGHVHDAWKVQRINDKSLMVNLSVEMWNYHPVSLDEINKAIAEFKRNEFGKTTNTKKDK